MRSTGSYSLLTLLVVVAMAVAHLVVLATAAKRSIDDGQQPQTSYIHLAASGNNNNNIGPGSVAAGYLLTGATDSYLNLSDPVDRQLLGILIRDSPDMRPSRDYKDFKDISVKTSQRAWRLLREHASLALRSRIELAWPTLNELLSSARVSGRCQTAIWRTLEGAKRLESWSIKLLNSWGSFPMSGIFEGTYGDVGSFHTCVDIRANPYIDHAHYCSVTFRPVMPSRKDYELVVRKEPDELLNIFEQQTSANGASKSGNSNSSGSNNTLRDAFSDILEHAQYHHYIYYKWGTCWPIDCSPFDVKRVTKLVGRRNILMQGPVKCYSRNESDYEQPDSVQAEPDGGPTSNLTSLEFGGPTNGTQQQQHRATGRKLILSIWDKNDGIFIWKPHFSRAQKMALSVLALASVFIAVMTMIDIVCNRLPRMLHNLGLALRALPLNGTRRSGCFRTGHLATSTTTAATATTTTTTTTALTLGDPQFGRDLALGATGASLKQHPTQVGFSVVPSTDLAPGHPTIGQRLPGELGLVQHATDDPDDDPDPDHERAPRAGWFMGVVDDCSILTNGPQFFRVSAGQMKNDILCLNGLRCITMIWIIMTHTMMYNDWSAFSRTRDVEKALKSLMSQPLFNGSYLVDTFFLMSGLLSAYTAFRHSQGLRAKFNSFAYIFGRWLRLTPQIFFVSMMYIVLPALSYGPHWYPIVAEYSENCVNNWWINALHLQAFYKKEEMCNFVTWWISIDFFYHFFALAVIWVTLLLGHRSGFLSMSGIISGGLLWQCLRHYELALPPNVLSTIPQTGAMWTTMTLDFFWTPWTHVVPFFFGFYIGYLMALKQKLILRELNTRRALAGWLLSISLLVLQSYSTYWWVTGLADYTKLASTVFYTICQIIWAGALCWTIIACHHGYGGPINRVLSWRVFVVLGKASYLVYLSHFQILFLFYGNQNLLLEPTPIVMIYIIFGNIFLSTLLGIVLCIVYELPWLKAHRRLMKYV